MDDDKIVAAILAAPIINHLADTSGDVPPDVAVSIYEEVLLGLHKRKNKDKS